jgi:hypothetical protein
MRKSALSLLAGLSIGVTSMFAATGWDSGFPTFPTLSSYERISAICHFSKLYVAVNYSDDSTGDYHAYLYRLDGSTWNVVPNSSVGGHIFALSAASSSSGTRLFVGGDFDDVGPSSLAATNVAMLNPIPTNNPTWSSLGTGAANGADGPVHSLKAQNWSDNYYGYLYDRIMVYIGGQFTKAGNLTTPSIASWNGLGYLASGWARIGNATQGYGIDDDAWYRNIYGIAPDTYLYNYQTYLTGLYLAGNFRKTIGSVVNYNATKWNGSSWRNLGKGLLKGGVDPNTCALSFSQYPSYQGNCAVFTNSTAYIGGFFDDVQDKGGTNYFIGIDNGCGCPVCGFLQLSTATVNSSEILSTSTSLHINGAAFCMALKGTTPYVGGNFSTDDGSQVFYAAKLVSGSWQSLPVTSSISPEDAPIAATADSTSAYFATYGGVFRYIH